MNGIWSFYALALGAAADMLLGDPRFPPHPVVLMGGLISALEKLLRRLFPKTPAGERAAGGLLWLFTAAAAFLVPFALLRLCYRVTPWLGFGLESVMCWQCLAARSLQRESMKVKKALDGGDIEKARHAVSMIVGRDTAALSREGVAKAAVETVAENASDGVIAPLTFLALGGGALGMLYKAVNTMDSMLGYVEEPYKNFGFFPAVLDDVFNFIPARLSALIMLAAGGALGYDAKRAFRVFRRDRRKHTSPNSAQTESVMAGLLGLRLAGDASYHGVLHKKPFIGDPLREAEPEDISRACRIMLLTSAFALCLFGGLKLAVLFLTHAV